MNICSFFGRVGSDIDLRVNGETTVAQFSVAVNRHSRDRAVDFFRFKAFNKQAEVINKYFHKGSRICLTASASQPPKYTNRDGVTIYPNVEFIVRDIDFVDTKNEAQNTEQPAPVPTPQQTYQTSSIQPTPTANDFMSIPDGLGDEPPFN